MMTTVANPTKRQPTIALAGPISAAYCILMKARDAELSAFQRLVSVILIKGHADDRVS